MFWLHNSVVVIWVVICLCFAKGVVQKVPQFPVVLKNEVMLRLRQPRPPNKAQRKFV